MSGRESLNSPSLPAPSEWRSMQTRGIGASYRHFTAHRDDVARYHALPWYRRVRTLESWLRKQYGDVIYMAYRYAR